MNIAVLVFDDAEELDFVGPWRSSPWPATSSNRSARSSGRMFIPSPRRAARCAAPRACGSSPTTASPMRLGVDYPAGAGRWARLVENPAMLDWIRAQAEGRALGDQRLHRALLLTAGPARGKAWSPPLGLCRANAAAGARHARCGRHALCPRRQCRDGGGRFGRHDMALWLTDRSGRRTSPARRRRAWNTIPHRPSGDGLERRESGRPPFVRFRDRRHRRPRSPRRRVAQCRRPFHRTLMPCRRSARRRPSRPRRFAASERCSVSPCAGHSRRRDRDRRGNQGIEGRGRAAHRRS